MANELTINIPTITYVKPPFNEMLAPGIVQVSINGKQIIHGSIATSITDSTLNKGNVATIGYCVFHNQDTTNNVTIGSDGTLFNLMLKPAEWSVVRWNAAAIHVKAAASTPILEYWVVED
jgi:hypothetical protein